MFGTQFYPTTDKGCALLTKGLDLSDYRKVLDPSAGRGDILEYVKKATKYSHWGRSNTELFAIEIDADLRAALTDKGFKVVDTDFLAYSGHHYFDLILMNPPFADGAAHLLKAWEIANGAEIRCLLNAETIRHPYTRDRQQLQAIIAQYGEAKELGQIFKNADRPSDVEVVLVTLKDTRQPETFRLDFDPALMGANDYHLADIPANELASANIFENYEGRYNAAIAAFKELLAARQKVAYYMDGLLSQHTDPNKIISNALKEGKTPDMAYAEYLTELTREAWSAIFSKTKLASVSTDGVRRQISHMQATQGDMAFTAKNMEELFYLLALNKDHIIVQCALEVFDNLTKHYPENRLALEGWKSNSAYVVGKQFILPGVKSYYSDSIDFREAQKLADIDKVMCFLTGKKFENILSINRAYDRQAYFGQWVYSEFFRTKLFKKGTMHFRWLDESLMNDFNALIARERWGWIPEKTKSGMFG